MVGGLVSGKGSEYCLFLLSLWPYSTDFAGNNKKTDLIFLVFGISGLAHPQNLIEPDQ
jgi:hypothetical protein